jgi:plasmid stability protein
MKGEPMTNQTLTLEIPSGLYTQLKRRAENANRSVEDETLELLAGSVSATEELPAELQQAIASLEFLDDEALGRAARSRLAVELAEELETLHFKQQREGLTTLESQRCNELVQAYERAMLVRAHAAVLLKRRGIDISVLVPPS